MKQIVPLQMDRPYSLVAAVLLAFALAMVPGQVMANLEQARTQGIAWLIEEQNGDGSWGADGARVAATAEVLSALRGSGVNHGVVYSRGLAWLANVRADSVDSLARKIIALEQAGIDTQQLGLVDELIARRNFSKAWGAFAGYQHGLPDSALAMDAIRVAGASYASADISTYLSLLLNAQQAGDSGWPYMAGAGGQQKPARIMPTAYNLVTFSGYYAGGGWNIASDIERAVKWLLNTKRQGNGAFLDDATVSTGAAHKTALAYLAIDAARGAGIAPPGVDAALADARSFLLGQQLSNGSWDDDPYQSALVLRTLPAVILADGDQDGLPDGVETMLGTNPAVVDSRRVLRGNGVASDLAAGPLLVEVLAGQVFNHVPTAHGGSLPYTWSLSAGALPAGVSLHTTTGALSGTPNAAGVYLFTLTVTDAAGSSVLVGNRIHVIAPDDTTTDTDGDGVASSVELANGTDPLSRPLPLPTALDDTLNTPEDQPASIRVTANDASAEQRPLRVIGVTVPGYGSAQISADRHAVRYSPAPDYVGPDSFVYTIEDDAGGQATATVSVTVSAVNDAPVAAADSAETVTGLPLTVTVLANDQDVDADSLSVAGVTPASNGSVSIAPDAQTVVYVPQAGFTGGDSFTYTASDGQGGEASVSVNVTVTAPLDGPYEYYVLNPNWASASAWVVSLVNGNTITAGATVLSLDRYQQGTLPASDLAQGTVITGTGPFEVGGGQAGTHMPVPAAFAGTAFVLPHIRDGHGYYLFSPHADAQASVETGSGGFNVFVPQGSVVPVDAGTDNAVAGRITADRPILVAHTSSANGDVYAVPPAARVLWGGRSTTAWVGALDDDTQVHVYASSGASSHFTLSGGERRAIAVGGGAAQGQADVLHIVADKPIAAVQHADGDGLASTAYLGGPQLGRRFGLPLDTQYAVVTCVTPATQVTVDDGINPPQIQSCNASGAVPGKVYVGSEVAGVHLMAGTRIESSAPVVVTYEAALSDDEHNLLGTRLINALPELADPGDRTDGEGDAVVLAMAASDPDGQSLSYGAAGLPPGLGIEAVTGEITGTLGYETAGSYPVVVTVSDGVEPVQVAFGWTVTDTNRPPVPSGDGVTTSEDTPATVAVLANDGDPDGDALTVSGVTQAPHGAVIINADQTLSYSPASNYYGPDSFTYTVSDGKGGSATAPVGVTVSAVNDAPVAAADTATTPEDTSVSIAVLGNDGDPDGDPVVIDAAAQASHGTVVVNAGNTVAYTPDQDFHGSDSFSYTVIDGHGGTDTAEVTVTVQATNDAPSLVGPGDQSHGEGDAVSVVLQGADVDGDSLSYSATGLPPGLAIGAGTGVVSGTLAAGSAGSYAVSATVTDGTLPVSVGFLWSVAPPPDTTLPVVTAPPAITVEATGSTTPVDLGTASAVDEQDGPLTPTPDTTGPFALGTHLVIWRATDAAGNTGTATQAVVVQDTTPPALTVPPQVSVQVASAEPVAVALGQAIATDLFVPVGLSNDAPGLFPEGASIITWTATDANGNAATGQQLVRVIGPNTPAVAQWGAAMVADVGAGGARPDEVVVLGAQVFFVGDDGVHGRELWVSDGTATGTRLVRDIVPGAMGSSPRSLTVISGALYFLAEDGAGGLALWQSDGTEAGTVNRGAAQPGSQYITLFGTTLYVTAFELHVAGSNMYFVADDGVNGYELWKNDGAASSLVKDIRPGTQGSGPVHLVAVGDTLYFAADDGVQGYELWKTDGTAAGTVLVKDVSPGAGASISPALAKPTADGATLYFVANDGTSGYELWKTDGTAVGTQRVKDIWPGAASATPGALTVVGSKLFFSANDGTSGLELWLSDGTEVGTALVQDIHAGPNASTPIHLVAVGGLLFFAADDGIHGQEPWYSDGTPGGTALVQDIRAGFAASQPVLTASGGLFFSADDGVHGRELWRAGITLTAVVDGDGDGLDDGWEFQYFGDRSADGLADADADGLSNAWEFHLGTDPTVSDSDADGMPDVYEVLNHMDPQRDDAVEDFDGDGLSNADEQAMGTAPFAPDTDGDGAFDGEESASGSDPLNPADVPGNATARVMGGDAVPGAVENPTAVGSLLFFSFDDGTNGRELWVSDGTVAGTRMVKDLAPGPTGSHPRALGAIAGALYFLAEDSGGGLALWGSDGTEAGTQRLGAVQPSSRYITLVGGRLYVTAFKLHVIGGTMYFVANDGVSGPELWKNDGTGSTLVKDIRPGPGGAMPVNLTVVGGTLYFAADDGVNGYELWKSDGTEAGTAMLKDINAGAGGSFASYLVGMGGGLYFVADDGVHGQELWTSDGTAAGTLLVKDIRAGSGASSPNGLTVSGGRVYFSANDGSSGFELWASDGTEAGTALFADIAPGAGSSLPGALADVGGRLYFAASDGVVGQEPWTSDTSVGPPVLLKDIQPGLGSSLPVAFTAAGGYVFFTTDTGTGARELWRAPAVP